MVKWLRKEELSPQFVEKISEEIYDTAKFFEVEDSDEKFVSCLSSEIQRVLVDDNMNVLAVEKKDLIAVSITRYFLRW